jgi:hypothetical protein
VSPTLPPPPPPTIGSIGHRQKSHSKSSINLIDFLFHFPIYLSCLIVNSEQNSSITNSIDIRQCHKSFSSPPSSYAASSSHITEIDEYDCDLDSGYNDEHDSPLLLLSSSSSSVVHLIPTSPWYDMPIADEMFIWVIFLENDLKFSCCSLHFLKDFQLYPDIARELPSIKTDNSSFESTDDDTLMPVDYFTKLNIEEYL